jgi:hypothetical protein
MFSGQQGALYDASVGNSLFQDAAGTIPATANNDPVRRINDLSGNGNHAIAGSDAARPLLKISGGQRWLEFDGVDDYLLSAFASTVSFDRISALRVLGYTNGDRIFGKTPTGGFQGEFLQTATDLEMLGTGIHLTLAAGTDAVITERQKTGVGSRGAVDAGAYTTGTAISGSPEGVCLGAYDNGAQPGNIRLYGVLMQSVATLTDPEIATIQTYMGALQGRVV